MSEIPENDSVQCDVCFHGCVLKEGQTGFCRARTNRNGTIEPSSYGYISSAALDPIEKKPLADFYPGSLILSVGSYGCNLRCPFCQNHEIAQNDLQARCEKVTPEQLAEKALELKPYGNIGIAFTYNEPMISWEFIRDTFRLAKEKGLKTVVVTNGTASVETLEKILPWTDAFNIDLKAYTQEGYDWLQGDLETVKRFIQKAAGAAHVEVTTLVVPGRNDSEQEMEALSSFLASVSPDIVLHLSRYFPRWKETEDPTPVQTLQRLQKTAEKHLHHVLLGNV